MRGNKRWIAGGAALGVLPTLLGWLLGRFLTWELLSTPFRLVGEGLRRLSLSGVVGNLAAWAIVLVICCLPVAAFAWRGKRGWPAGWEDRLLWLVPVELFFLLYYLVNPTYLGKADLTGAAVRDFFSFAVCVTILSTLAAWAVLRFLRALDGRKAEGLSGLFQPLLRVCAALLAAGAVHNGLSAFVTQYSAVSAGNTGVAGSELRTTLLVMLLLAVLKGIPDLLAALTLLWGGELAAAIGQNTFAAETVELCQRTAESCRRVAQATVLLAAFANLLQMLMMGRLLSSNFNVVFPLLTLALSVGLFLLCRFLQRGRELQEDNDSII